MTPTVIPNFALALPDAPAPFLAVLKMRNLDIGNRNRHRPLPLATDHLPVRDVLSQILLDPPADDIAEPGVILLDLLDVRIGSIHLRLQPSARSPPPIGLTADGYSFELPLAKILATYDNTSEAQVSQ